MHPSVQIFCTIKAVIKGPCGTGLEVEASHPVPRPRVHIEDARSHQGGLTAMDATGRGAEVKTVEVERDIQVSSTPPQEYNHPKPRPPA